MEKLLISRYDACQMLSISTKTFDRLRYREELKAVCIGARVFVTPEDLQAFVERLKKERIVVC